MLLVLKGKLMYLKKGITQVCCGIVYAQCNTEETLLLDFSEAIVSEFKKVRV